MNTETQMMRAHVEAVTELLLGRHRMQPGVAITGGDPLTPDGQRQMINCVTRSDTDVLHLAYATTPIAVKLTGVELYVPRENACYLYTGCRFWMSAGSTRAVILPREGRRGHFRFKAAEIVHLGGKPKGVLDDGIRRADQRLLAIMQAKRTLPRGTSATLNEHFA